MKHSTALLGLRNNSFTASTIAGNICLKTVDLERFRALGHNQQHAAAAAHDSWRERAGEEGRRLGPPTAIYTTPHTANQII